MLKHMFNPLAGLNLRTLKIQAHLYLEEVSQAMKVSARYLFNGQH